MNESELDQTQELAAGLGPVLRRATTWESPRVENLRRLSGGASRETWQLEVIEADGPSHRLILQRKRSFVVGDWADAEVEAQLLEAARQAGVPTPSLIAWSAGNIELGLPFLLVEHIEGETIPQRILRKPQFAPAREKLARQYGEALGCIQQIRAESVSGLKAQDPLERYQQILDDIGEPSPVLAFGFRWLERNRPDRQEQVVVHGDFRNGNGIVDPERGLRAIIDWELSHWGDPLEDLGWFCIRAWRFGERSPVGGFGDYDQIIEGYESVSGRNVDRQMFQWWQIMGTVRWAIICRLQGATHWQGHRRSLELAATGRRTAEAEYDLMLLLP